MTVMNEGALIQADSLNAVEVFTGERLDEVLQKIKDEVSGFVPDLTTDKGRKEVASLAFKVSKSKVLLDGLGKDLVADWKAKASKVDAARKNARDFLDNLRDEVRRPLTEWEEEQARIERERVAAIKEAEEKAERLLREREAAVEKREREARDKEEAEARAKIQAEQAAAEKERLRIEAEANAKRDADEKIRKARAAARDRIEKANRDAQKKIDDAAAAEKRRQDEAAAVKAEAERKEEARKADLEHRRGVNNVILAELINNIGCDEATGKRIIEAIFAQKIPHVTINY